MTIHHLDHLVLTVSDLDATCAFYRQLDLEVVTFGAGRKALRVGNQKIKSAPGSGTNCSARPATGRRLGGSVFHRKVRAR
jgi:catechol 2,3-dioxygenase-like lactoylglutathione lyase family enzyme